GRHRRSNPPLERSLTFFCSCLARSRALIVRSFSSMTHRMKIASLLSLGLVSLPACGGPSSDPFDSNSSSADDDEDKNDSDEKDDDGDKGETGEEPTDDDDSNGDSTTGGETNTTTSPGTTGPDPDTGEEVVPGGGYIQSGAWKGYAFTAVEGGTIT